MASSSTPNKSSGSTSKGPGAELGAVDKAVIGTTGLPIWSGIVSDELLPELQGDKKFKVYREMFEQDPVLGGIILAIELLVRRTPFPVEPAELPDDASDDDLEAAAEAADFVEQCLNDMHPSWTQTLPEILTMIPFGFSYHEIVYKIRQGNVTDGETGLMDPTRSSKYNDGKVGWKAWPIRAQETRWSWDLDDEGDVLAMWQLAPPVYKEVRIPISKALHFRPKAHKGNPEGTSLLRSAYRPWYFAKQIEKIEAIGVERDLAGLPVAGMPPEYMSPGATDQQKALFADVQKIVSNIRRDTQEGVIIPRSFDATGHELFSLTLLTSGGSRQFDTGKIIQRYNQYKAMALLADFMLLGHESVGSFALASTKTDLFSWGIGAILDAICDEINTSAIPHLLTLNGIDLKYMPQLAHGAITAPDLNALGTFIQKLALAGFEMFPNEDLEHYLMEAAGLPATGGTEEPDENELLDLLPDVMLLPRGEGDDTPTLGVPATPAPTPGQPAGATVAPAGTAGAAGPTTRPAAARNPSRAGATPAQQAQRPGRTAQSAAARQVRQPGAIQRTAASEPEGFAVEDINRPYTRSVKVPKKRKVQTASMIRTLLSVGHSPTHVARYLGVRPQHVHNVRQRMIRGLQNGAIAEQGLGPVAQAGIINAIDSD